MTYCDLGCQFSEKPMTYLESAPLNYVYLMYHTYIEKKSIIQGVPRFLHDLQGDLEKKATYDFKMVKINQGDCVDDIPKEISDGGD